MNILVNTRYYGAVNPFKYLFPNLPIPSSELISSSSLGTANKNSKFGVTIFRLLYMAVLLFGVAPHADAVGALKKKTRSKVRVSIAIPSS